MTATVLTGDVRVLDAADARAEAIAYEDGRIVAVGDQTRVQELAGPAAQRIDVGKATVLPGFIDNHHHASLVALWGGSLRLTRPTVTDIESLQRALRQAAEGLPEGAWLVATDWDELLLDERRPPTRSELDDAVPDHPLMAMHYGCHRAVANSRALELAGIDRHTKDPAGGAISRGKGGVPDGLLVERGMSRVETLSRASLCAKDADGFMARLRRHHETLLSVGITAVVDTTVPGDVLSLYREAERRGTLLVPTVALPVSTTGYLEEPWDALRGPKTGDGSPMLRVGPVKLVFDGAPGCSMCLGWWQSASTMLRAFRMSVGYRSLDPLRATLSVEPRLGWRVRSGIAIYSRDDAARVVAGVVGEGFSVATHAIGNEALDIALGAYESAGAGLTAVGRPRIEHAMFLDTASVARIADLGAAVVTQPSLFTLPAYGNAAPVPGLRNIALRWLLDAGVPVAASSDYPVTAFDPLLGVRAAVSRRTRRGHTLDADQAIDLTEALAAYTRTAAEIAGLADVGTLRVGHRADLLVLDGALSERSLEDIRVRATILGGELAYGELV